MRPKNPDIEALLSQQMMVSFTRQQSDALEMVATSIGMRVSQYVRQLAIERLVQLRVIKSPMAKFEKPAAVAEALAAGA